ncbi:MAG: histidine--tRNA ligase [Gemmatimonadaceae bacterium]|jgi:histidyl-tRNA synthetase|nr:histidine--tRNA ligase [Gemmatimonadaceae bacterium]
MGQRALPGFRDFYPAEFADRAHLFATFRRIARRFGFVEYDGPPLEPLELYTQKSGEEIVGQLYNFTDKGGREVALRPEMTPTVARLVGARAAALPKPVRWFSIPQLFRYERQQKGRLREHFQLNVDIFGESDSLADAELLAVACEIMRAFDLGPDDVRARVSDRRLLNALLSHLGITDAQAPAVYAVLDKLERQPQEISREKLALAGCSPEQAAAVLAFGTLDFDAAVVAYGQSPTVQPHLERFAQYRAHLDALGVLEYVHFDLSIVRGLAYYTGIVFELFDAKGEFRAICGGGRYDTLLSSLGGSDLPALGFGMGDVVLGELLRARGKLASTLARPDFWLVPDDGADVPAVLRAARALRRHEFSVVHALDADRLWNRKPRTQMQDAQRQGARAGLRVLPGGVAEVILFDRSDGDAASRRVDLAALLAGDAAASVPVVAQLRDLLAADAAPSS